MNLLIFPAMVTNIVFGGHKSQFGRKHGVKDSLKDAAAVPHEFVLREHAINITVESQVSNVNHQADSDTRQQRKSSEPVEYKIGGFIDWRAAEAFCQSREGRLCTQKEICPDGELKPPRVQMSDGDLFVATRRENNSTQMDCADTSVSPFEFIVPNSLRRSIFNTQPNQGGENAKSTNSWLSIGSMMKEERLCKHHHQFAGCPHWGEVANRDMAGLKRVTYCCGSQIIPKERKQWCFNTRTDDDMMLSWVDVWPHAEKGKPKIFCMAYTHDKKHHHAAAMAQYWMHRCDGYLLASNKDEPEIGAKFLKVEGGESYRNMYNKVRGMWAYAHATHGNFDWFYICGDDQYVIVENLRQYLLSSEIRDKHDAGEPLYLGRKYKSYMGVFNTGGGGYLLNKHALDVLIKEMENQGKMCKSVRTSMEDVYIARCLAAKKVYPYDTRDADGSERFHPFQPGVTLMYNSSKVSDWFKSYTKEYARKEGLAAVSKASISFHYIKPDGQKELTRILYDCRKPERVNHDEPKSYTFFIHS